MYIYLVLNTAVFLLALIFENTYFKVGQRKREADYIYLFFCIILLTLSSFRYGIGVDYKVYYDRYMSGYIDGNPLTIFVWMFRGLHFLNIPYQMVIVLCSCGFLLPLFYFIYKYISDYKLYALGILQGFMFYIYSFNAFRQYLCIGMFFYGLYKYIITKKIRYIIITFLSGLIHPMLFLTVPVYLVAYFWKPQKKLLKIIQAISITIYCIIDEAQTEWILRTVAGWILLKIPSYAHYVTSPDTKFIKSVYTQSMEFIPKVLFIPCMIILPYIIVQCQKDQKNISKKTHKLNYKEFVNGITYNRVTEMLAKTYFLYFVGMSFRFGSEIISRFLQFFSILGIFVIPISFAYLDKRKKLFASTLKMLIIIICIYTQLRCIRVKACGAYPYQSIFNSW